MAAEVLAAGGASVTVYDRMPSLGTEAPARRARRPQPHPQRGARPFPGALRRARAALRRPSRRCRRKPCAPGARRSASRPSSASSGRVFPEVDEGVAAAARLAAAARAVRASSSARAAAGSAGTMTGVCCSTAPTGGGRRRRRDGAGARRGELAAARLDRRLGPLLAPSGVAVAPLRAGQLRLPRRLVGNVPRAASRASR